MPLPLVPVAVGAGLVALLFAGSKEAAAKGGTSVATEGVNATPTNQSTGGANGGAQSPSHADYENTTSEPAQVDGAPSVGGGASMTGVIADPVPSSDPWAQDSSPSFTGGAVAGPSLSDPTGPIRPGTGAVGVLTGVTVASGRAVADAFKTTADAFHWIF